MNLQQGFSKIALALVLVLILAGAALAPRPACASMEDAAIFYDELKQEGQWVDYGDYGPVWYPTQVQENWRPYVDGRWTPSEEGYVFETQEPWAPETYHYGNWMPTPEYGWVWVPGRTWYPNTVAWRTSPESEAPDTSYVGWAPVPPPDYTPAPGYYPEGYNGTGSYAGPVDSLITSPFWIFVKAASFLLGLNAPYAPTYSYWGSNALIPPAYVPYYYGRTIIVNNYYTPGYYPGGFMAGSGGYYNWGPPIPYVARVTRINQTAITNYMQQVNIYQRRNVVPAAAVLDRHPYWRDVMPPAMLSRQPLPLGPRFQGGHVARVNLVQPNLVNATMMKNVPAIPGTIPKARLAGPEAGPWRRGVPGAALPASSLIRPNRQTAERWRNIPAPQRLEPVSPSARHWQVPQAPGTKPEATVVQPGRQPRHHGPEPTSTTPGMTGPANYGPTHSHYTAPGPSPAFAPHEPLASQENMGRQRRMPGAESFPGAPGPSQAATPHERHNPREYQPSPWSRHEQSPKASVTPDQHPRHGQTQTSPPGTPPTGPGFTPRVQPPPQVQHQPQPQAQPQVQHQPQPQAQPQVQRQPQPHYQPQMRQAPQPQVHQAPQPQVHQPPQAQVHQAPQHQPQPQAQNQSRPQGQQKQQGNRNHNQQNQ